ncbi:MAG: hypothetical protein H6677_02830 [Candidatus Obscuribacterales bacterium]|nr:hypothetical protein [Cyanobacteria bacterium HKST-UBA01]MCB9467184.1 hypothetical protein [Candidatus Obscuribacterales bacterium]
MEINIFNRLLSVEFPGVEHLRMQIEAMQVQTLDENGSLSLKVESGVRADVQSRVPVEASYSDSEEGSDDKEPRVHMLLHVLDGSMKELEIYKDDGSAIVQKPLSRKLSLFTPNNWENE